MRTINNLKTSRPSAYPLSADLDEACEEVATRINHRDVETVHGRMETSC